VQRKESLDSGKERKTERESKRESKGVREKEGGVT
jgi:hypothetical protein